MAAPEKILGLDYIDDGSGQDIQWVAPQIGSALTVQTLNKTDRTGSGGWEFAWVGGSGSTGLYYGARKPLPAARDLTVKRFLWFSAFCTSYATERLFADLVDGGLRLYLTDSSGNYSGYIIYGRNVSNIINNSSSFSAFKAITSDVFSMWWCLDLDRTPDYSSGTLDLTDVVAIEVHIQHAASYIGGIANAPNLAVGNFGLTDNLILRAGEVADPADFTLLPQTFLPTPIAGGNRQGQTLSGIFDGTNGSVYATICPVNVGDGSTATYFRQGRGTLACQLSYEAVEYEISQGRFPNVLPCYLADDNGDRTHTINQSASDDVQFSDFTWSGYDFPDKAYAVEVTGSTSGTCVFLNNTFARAQFVKLRHATATDSIFDACGYVEITADTSMTGSTIRNAPAGSSALKITGAAGDYSGIEVRLNNPSATHDIALGSGGSGTYNISGVTVPSGYTLKIHNDSATNAITVVVPSGITTSTSTAGGTITLQQPPQTFTVSGIISGSRLRVYNTTTATEIVNQIVSGTSYVGEYSEGGDFSEGDSVNVRLAYVNGTSAKQEFSANALAGASGWSLLAEQVDDDVYNSFGIDGSTITQFQADYVTDQVDVVIGANFNLSTFYAWWVYNLTTESGIRDFFGGITALDQSNFKINTSTLSLYLDNSTNTNIRQLDNRRFFRSDGGYPVLDPTSGGGGIDVVWRNQIFIAETGVSGLTPQESALLTNGLSVINNGVKKASLLIPHTENL